MKILDVQDMTVGQQLWLDIEQAFISNLYLRITVYSQVSNSFSYIRATNEGHALYIKRTGTGISSKDFIIDLEKSYKKAGRKFFFEEEDSCEKQEGDIIFYFKNAVKNESDLSNKSIYELERMLDNAVEKENYKAAQKIKKELETRVK